MVSRRSFLTGALAATTSLALASCSSGGGSGSGGSGGSGPYKFTYLRPTWGPATFTKAGPYQQALEKGGNVAIDVQIIPVIDYDTKVNTILASGDIPDVIWGSGPANSIWRDAQDQGAFLPIDEYLEKYEAVRNAVPDNIWNMLKSKDGESFFIPNLIWPQVPFMMFYRKDLFDQARLEEPKTVDDFVETLRAAKKAFPKHVPLSLGYEWSTKDLATSFDFCLSGWEPTPDDADKIVPWHVKESEIDFYFWLQSLHKEGLIDPEFKVNKEPNFAGDKFIAGKVAMTPSHWGGFADTITKLRQVEPKAEVRIMDPFNATGGNRMVIPIDRGFYVSSKMKDPDRFFEFLNWTLSDGGTLRRYGVEGKMFKKVSGANVPIPDPEREEKFKGPQVEPVQFLGPFSEKLDWDGMKIGYEASKLPEEFDYIQQKFATYTAKYHTDYRDITALSETENKKGSQIYEDYMKQVVDASIIDHKTTKQNWLDAADKWRKAGGDAIIDEVNAAQKDKSMPNYVEG